MICEVQFNKWEFEWYTEPRDKLVGFLAGVGVESPFSRVVDENGKERFVGDDGFFEKNHLLDIQELAKAGIEFKCVKALQSTTYDTQMFSMVQKLLTLERTTPAPPQHITIQISDQNPYAKIKDVRVEEDCCTDHLREVLQDGWQILAICNAYKQRRPDYILGREENAGTVKG